MNKSLEQLTPPTTTDLLDATKRNLSTEMNCINVGEIQEFDAATQVAKVQLLLKKVTAIFPDGTRTVEERPALWDVPCVTLFGGNAFLSMPIQVGDNCLVLFNDREIDQWFAKGGIQTPMTYRAHSVSDAIAIVGIRSLQNSITDYLAEGIRLSLSPEDRISITDGLIESIATLFKHNGNMQITNDLEVDRDTLIKRNALIQGNVHIEEGLQVDGIVTGAGGGGTIAINANVTLGSGKTMSAPVVSAGNGATGSYANVTVQNGIVIGGS